jgi:hypothetical protein
VIIGPAAFEMATTPLKRTGTVRVAPAVAAIAVVRDFGLDAAAILTEAGWSPGLLDDPDNVVPFSAMCRLMYVAAARTEGSHFGLLVGAKAGLSVLGALGFISRSAPDVRSALELLIRHFAHHATGAAASFEEEGEVARLGHRILRPEVPGSIHMNAGALAVGFQLMRVLCGPYWRPLETSFAFQRPADELPYRDLFGDRVRFEASGSALSFSASWLDCEIVGADPELLRVLLPMVSVVKTPNDRDLRDEVCGVLERTEAAVRAYRQAQQADDQGGSPATFACRYQEAASGDEREGEERVIANTG